MKFLKPVAWIQAHQKQFIATFTLVSLGTLGAITIVQKEISGQHHSQMLSETAPVLRKNILVTVSATGTIKPITPVNISPKTAGKLVQLLVDQGYHVKKGQVLARMDNSNLTGAILKAKGVLAAAEQNLSEAKNQLATTEALFKSNSSLFKSQAVSKNDFIASRSAYMAAKSHIQSLQNQLMSAKGDYETASAAMNDTIIRAPFDGTITQKYANVGAFVTPTTTATSTTSATSSSILALASDLEAVANVAEIDEPEVFINQLVRIKADAYPNKPIKGTVRLISPESIVQQNVSSFEVHIKLNSQDLKVLKLKSGMNITADFVVGRHNNALMIPTPAILSRKSGMGVFLLGDNDKPVFKRIKVGATVGSSTEVLDGLKEGDRVFITFPSGRKPNGKPVNPSSAFGSGGGGRIPR